jgi:acyl-coenzyme A thioesterase PaaI-like protein
MSITDVLLSPPLQFLVYLLNTVRVLIGLVFSIPAVLWALIRGGTKRLRHFEDLFAVLNAVPFGGYVFDYLIKVSATYSGMVLLSLSPRMLGFVFVCLFQCLGSIDAHVVSLELGSAQVSMRERPWLRNPFSSIHAAALVNLGELTTGLAIVPTLQRAHRTRGIPVKLETTFIKKSRGLITATSKLTAAMPMTPGSHNITVDATLRDVTNEVVAQLTAHWRVDVMADKKSS